MARLLICVYPRMVTLYDDLRCAPDVAAAINAGEYLPPGLTPGGLVATCLGNWVFVERPVRPAASTAACDYQAEDAGGGPSPSGGPSPADGPSPSGDPPGLPSEKPDGCPCEDGGPVPGVLPPGWREQQVLQGLADGLSIGQIAFQFGLAQRTVRFYIMALKSRLDVQTTAQLVGRAMTLGLIR
jgi:DNA-binding CsgD family transcriptional regulator